MQGYTSATMRIVSLLPAATEILYAIGAGDSQFTGYEYVLLVASMDPNLTLFNVQTLNEYLGADTGSDAVGATDVFWQRWPVRADFVGGRTGRRNGIFGSPAAERDWDWMALGARRSQVLGLVLREGAVLIGAGTVIGFLGAVGLAKAMSAITSKFADAFTVGTNDPRLLIGAPLLLAGLALLACYIPARGATAIDPLQALRQD